jgi:hypothetical protein
MKTITYIRTAAMLGGILTLTLAAGCSSGGRGYSNGPYGYNNGYNSGYDSSYSSYGSSYPYSGYDSGYSSPQNYSNSYNAGYQNGVRADENRERHQDRDTQQRTIVVRERGEGREAQHANVDNDKYSHKDYKHSEKN